MLPLVSFLCLVLGASARDCQVDRPPSLVDAVPEKLVFVLAGQSNMAGRGGVIGEQWDGVVPPECRPNRSILRLSPGLRWEVASEPLHADIDVNKTCGVGPGMPFAHRLRSALFRATSLPPPPVGLVPCAIGGTGIQQWAKGTPLYEALLRRTWAAAGRLAAVIWYQGESDTVSLEDAEAYQGRMERLILDLRSDLGSPDLPLIQVALASGEGKFTEIVRQAQKSIKLANVMCVDAKGLQLEPDHVHLTTEAEVQLGKMLADSYLHIATAKCK